jgi:CheY-like chemotaxis protein
MLHLRSGRNALSTPSSETAPGPDAILVVEDDDDTREALCLLLSGESYRVLFARNGEEALHMLARTKPVLLITDLSMPVMTGWQLLEQIDVKRLLPGVPIIVLSADDRAPSKSVSFLQKPVGAAHLLEEISARLVSRLKV